MKALIDFDILRYEVGYAAETGWKAITEDASAIPPFDYVRDILEQRLAYIKDQCHADASDGYLTEGRTFRYDIAKKKPYKGNRVSTKPWHFDNLTVYMRDVLGAKVITHIEADDALAIDHLASPDNTIIVSRDKDLLQVPGLIYSWELGKQPAFGPHRVSLLGSLAYEQERKKLTGTGLAFFFAQVLMGDPTDNIPGLPKCGPKGAYETLQDVLDVQDQNPNNMAFILEDVVARTYQGVYGHAYEEEMTEQAQLCWLSRRLNEDGSPVLWARGIYE